jgi:hypothetical protein
MPSWEAVGGMIGKVWDGFGFAKVAWAGVRAAVAKGRLASGAIQSRDEFCCKFAVF